MKNSFFNLLTTAWRYAGERRKLVLLTYGLFVFANIFAMLEPFVFGIILNTIQQGGDNLFERVVVLVALYYSLSFFFWIFHGNGRVLEQKNAFHIERSFREHLFATVTHLPLEWQRNHHSGNTIDRVSKATKSLRDFSASTFFSLESIVRFLAAVVAIFLLSPWLLAILFSFAFIISFLIIRFDRMLIPQQKEVNRREHELASAVHDYVTNIVTVITLRLEKLAQAEVTRRIMHIFPIYSKNVTFGELKWFTVSMVQSLMGFCLVTFYLWDQLNTTQVLLIGNITMAYQYVGRLMQVFFNLTWQYGDIVRRNTDVLAVQPMLEDYEQYEQKIAQPVEADWQIIRIRKLSFTYRDEELQVQHLYDIALDLKRGRSIAFIGESGSGKSTTMTLIRGLLDADQVEIMIGKDKFSTMHVLAPFTTLIPQEPEIFENTLEYNITLGIEGREDIMQHAAELARFTPVLEKLPKGYQTDIREKGVNLSGGEKQRLALARGIFAAEESSIILLDEPTSSVDMENEYAIYKNILTHFSDRCIISSIHKLHLLPLFDHVYRFAGGKIVFSGRSDEVGLQD